MSLTADQAAAVAKRHGLTLQDAASLRALADDVDSADRIASQFSPPSHDVASQFATAFEDALRHDPTDRFLAAHTDQEG